ncbi:hypothetical protein JX265_007930 [Neoarthrinium moseri]|uniref:Alpha/beta hydrolase fold-3 domain-containing protein n=1 Tax=Neoarthrinium moseri TaxID=1658444 RepID=A0A9P9WIY7_9PEZI|nr:hypothetical protein JX265_007930 [Neoarthrinium moseri]
MATQTPTVGERTILPTSIKSFPEDNPALRMDGRENFHQERRHHLEVLGLSNLAETRSAPIGRVKFAGIRGQYGKVAVRLFYPKKSEDSCRGAATADVKIPALVDMHRGGYTIGSVHEFGNGLRLLAEKTNAILDDYEGVLAWTQGEEGASRGISAERVLGGGDSAGGNMTAALSLGLKDEGKQPMKFQILLFPEARLPFDTPTAAENNSGLYLECNGIFSLADHYLPRTPNKYYPPSHRYVSPSIQKTENLTGVPPAAVFTCGFDSLRDDGVEYANELESIGNKISEAAKASTDVTEGTKKLASA